jgi:hypothetical protein
MAAGLVRSAIFSTHRIKWLFVLNGAANVEDFIRAINHYCTICGKPEKQSYAGWS